MLEKWKRLALMPRQQPHIHLRVLSVVDTEKQICVSNWTELHGEKTAYYYRILLRTIRNVIKGELHQLVNVTWLNIGWNWRKFESETNLGVWS